MPEASPKGRLECEILASSDVHHTSHIYTGYRLLEDRGLLRLRQRIRPLGGAAKGLHGQIRVNLQGNLRLHYDLGDRAALDEEAFRECDFYFKRSLTSDVLHQKDPAGTKLFPLGLNFRICPNRLDGAAVHRAIRLHGGLRRWLAFVETINPTDLVWSCPRLRHLETIPHLDADPGILFTTRLWQPDPATLSPEENEERQHLNEMRVRCVILLRRHFKSRFHGGIKRTSYSERHFPDALLPSRSDFRMSSYLKKVKRYPICVSTEGLYTSTSFKIAEYVALGRAIVCERFNQLLPGDFREGIHYLAFDSPEACVEQADRLMNDAEWRSNMMLNNVRYYHAWLRPDQLVLHSILTAMEHASGAATGRPEQVASYS